jgi:hypothetical protein
MRAGPPQAPQGSTPPQPTVVLYPQHPRELRTIRRGAAGEAPQGGPGGSQGRPQACVVPALKKPLIAEAKGRGVPVRPRHR